VLVRDLSNRERVGISWGAKKRGIARLGRNRNDYKYLGGSPEKVFGKLALSREETNVTPQINASCGDFTFSWGGHVNSSKGKMNEFPEGGARSLTTFMSVFSRRDYKKPARKKIKRASEQLSRSPGPPNEEARNLSPGSMQLCDNMGGEGQQKGGAWDGAELLGYRALERRSRLLKRLKKKGFPHLLPKKS